MVLEDNIYLCRQQMGLCTQKDILYDELTVTEHLEYIARIKGYRGTQLSKEITNIIKIVNLEAEMNKFSC